MEKNYRIVFTEQNKVAVEEFDMPEIGENDILFQTEISQISTGTELTMLQGNVEPDTPWAKSLKYPAYPGYSNVSKIVKVGSAVPGELVGRRVLTLAHHQKYFTFPQDEYNLMFVPDSVASSDAVFGVIAQVVMASIRASQIRPGDASVVYGAGLVGQMLARLVRLAGSSRVIVTDVSDERLALLPKDPCIFPFNSRNGNVRDFVKEHTVKNEGAAVVFETTSVPSLVQEELTCLSRGGKLVITSSPKGKSVVDFDYCSRRYLTIIGAHNFQVHTPTETNRDRWTRKRDSDYFLELLDKKQITVDEMHTHRANFRDAPAFYRMLMEDRTKALSVCLTWED